MKTAANDAPKTFNVVHVKLYLSPQDISYSFLCDLEKGLHNFASPEEELSIATEIIEPSDIRARSTEMSKAILDEIRGLMQ